MERLEPIGTASPNSLALNILNGLNSPTPETSCDSYLHKQLREVQHHFHRGPGWFVGRETLGVLLVIGCKILTLGQLRQHRQNVIERGPRGFQNHLDAFNRVAALFERLCRPRR